MGHIRGISYYNLPQTLQDAIKAARSLGLNYLWVDALCIIQDSEQDKEKEMAKMQQIFQNAYITILAACASSSAEGFLRLRDGRAPVLRVPVRCESGRIGNLLLLPIGEGIKREPIHERAWTLQEVFLSPRLVVFGNDCVGWKCAKGDRGLYGWKDWNGYCASSGLMTVRLAPDGRIIRPTLSVYSADIASFRSSHLAERLPEIFQIWEVVVKDYSTRSMTNQEDKLPALSGIVRYFQTAMNDAYLAGLWRKHLLHELSWIVLNGRHPDIQRAPSWSWMALDGAITFQADRCQWYEPVAKIVSCEVTPIMADAPYSRVSGGTLVLNGMLRLVRENVSFANRSLFLRSDFRRSDFRGVVLDTDEDQDGDVEVGVQTHKLPQYWFFAFARCFTANDSDGEAISESLWGFLLKKACSRHIFPPGQCIFERVGWFNAEDHIDKLGWEENTITIV